jgi:hypothetical protein
VKAHARYSPSGAFAWLRCSGYESNPTSSRDADYGTAGHTLAERCLNSSMDAAAHLGAVIEVGDSSFTVDTSMAVAVQKYLDFVRKLPGILLVEERLPISHITGEADAYGTSDAVRLLPEEIIVIDLKLGANPRNRVSAENNPQLGIYGLAAFDQYSFIYDFQSVRLVIVQPRLDHISESTLTLSELQTFRKSIRPAESVQAGSQQCKWCRHRKVCPERQAFDSRQVVDDFADLSQEGLVM